MDKSNKVISLLLSTAMLFGTIPANIVFAAEDVTAADENKTVAVSNEETDTNNQQTETDQT